MSVLRSIEQKIEGAVERGFGRLFRSPVQPVELARKLAREMDAGRRVSVSGVYGPNDFHVFLSPRDREAFSSFEGSLRAELVSYLTEHAREQQLTLVAAPVVTLETDEDLRVGEFGIAARVSDHPGVETGAAPDAAPSPAAEPAAEAPPTGEPAVAEAPDVAAVPAGDAAPAAALARPVLPDAPAVPLPPVAPAAPSVATPAAPAPAPPRPTPNDALRGVQGTQIITPDQARAAGLAREDSLRLRVGGERHRISKRTTVLGRSRECDVVVADTNVSRNHAEIRHVGATYVLVDLKSTNGTRVNGRRVSRHQLEDGDVIEVGTTQIVVERT